MNVNDVLLPVAGRQMDMDSKDDPAPPKVASTAGKRTDAAAGNKLQEAFHSPHKLSQHAPRADRVQMAEQDWTQESLMIDMTLALALADGTPNTSTTHNGQWEGAVASKADDVSSVIQKKESIVDSIADAGAGVPGKDNFLIKSASNESTAGTTIVHGEAGEPTGPVTQPSTPQQGARDKVPHVDPKFLVSRLLPKIKIRTKSGNSDVKGSRSVQEASHDQKKVSIWCCFGMS